MFVGSIEADTQSSKLKTTKEELLEQVVDPEVVKDIMQQNKEMGTFGDILEAIKGVDPTKPERRGAPEPVIEEESGEIIEEEGPKPLSLTAIYVTDKTRYAIVNGTIVKEGEVIDTRTIKKIYEDKILIEDIDAVKELSIPRSKIRTIVEKREGT